MVFVLLWIRATLLLSVSWAIGIEMTPGESWKGLRGNFLRILGFGLAWMLVAVVFTLAYAYARHENPSAAFSTASSAISAVLFAFSGLISSAFSCAVYRQLVAEPSSPAGTPECNAVAA